MFSWVAAASYICTLAAGAMASVAVVARAVVDSKSSAMPQATFAITLAVHGAIRNTSHSWASEMWRMGSDGSSNSPTATFSWVSARNVTGSTKCVPCSVMTTFTRTPAFCSPRTISPAL